MMKHKDLFISLALIFLFIKNAFSSSNSEENSAELSSEKVENQNKTLKIDNDEPLSPKNNEVPQSNLYATVGDSQFSEHLNETSLLDTNLNTDALLRGFYVILALGCIFILYIGIKAYRLRQHRASRKYKVITTKGEDRESFFPLAAEDGEDEEIFNASNHQGYT